MVNHKHNSGSSHPIIYKFVCGNVSAKPYNHASTKDTIDAPKGQYNTN